jgi:hypothetical protein
MVQTVGNDAHNRAAAGGNVKIRLLMLTAIVAVLVGSAPAWAQYGGDDGAASVDDTTPAPGQVLGFTIEQGTCQSGSSGDIDLLPEARDLGDFTAAQNGGASGEVTIPTDIQPGSKTIQFGCTGPDGQAKVLSVSITVAGAGLAETGAGGSGDMLLNAGLVALVGVVLVAIATQRRKARLARAGQREHVDV